MYAWVIAACALRRSAIGVAVRLGRSGCGVFASGGAASVAGRPRFGFFSASVRRRCRSSTLQPVASLCTSCFRSQFSTAMVAAIPASAHISCCFFLTCSSCFCACAASSDDAMALFADFTRASSTSVSAFAIACRANSFASAIFCTASFRSS
jgi:hypothetical protein